MKSRIQIQIQKRKSVLLILLSLGLGACSGFSTTTEVSGLTYVHFDERFPSGMKDFMDSCHSPLVLKAGQKKLKMKGTCGSVNDLSSSEGKLIYGALAAREETFSALKKVISSDSGKKKIDHFPMKGCEIRYAHSLEFNQITLKPQDSGWGSRSGWPSFEMRFQGSDSERVATLKWTREISCPSRIKESLVAGTYGVVYPESQNFDVSFENFRLTLSNRLKSEGTLPPEFTGKLVATAEEDDIKLSREGLDLTIFGSALEMLDAKIESMVEEALQDTAQDTAELLAQAVPDEHQVCTMRTQDAESMVMTTDDADESTWERCRRRRIELE